MKRILTLLLALALLPSILAANRSTLQTRIQQERNKSASLAKKLHDKRARLGAVRARVQSLQAQLARTNAAMGSVRAQIGTLAAQERSTQARLSWNSIQLNAARKSLALQDGLLRRRLVDIYEYGEPDYLSVLLSAASFSDFVERWQDLQLLIKANERAVVARRNAERKVAIVQATLERTELALRAQQQAQQLAQNRLAALVGERENLVAIANQQKHQATVEVATYEELTAAEEARLEALIRRRSAEIAAAEAARRRAAGIAGNPTAPQGALAFSWPVTGTITSPFGWRKNPFGSAPEFHTGLDIAAPMGTTITAAASGTVMMAQWYGGYGKFILIDDGSGYSTAYGHLSAFYVTAGQVVKKGQAIGAVGTTGYSTGPHLHFEIRIDGKPVDPAPRLP
ncbi:MAG TPA: peptidoglycan DD-metalloendopeptidase family protein [Candidatus Dormibacteraeota bacterium]|nr:peptidoglycan DD-metalloendopeptidase family protein [Candidatus Dormibacteraeota bacterium]